MQQRREATLVLQVMPQHELVRTEFFNDFLDRDGLYWGSTSTLGTAMTTLATCAFGATVGARALTRTR